jgi:hypothetical protein
MIYKYLYSENYPEENYSKQIHSSGKFLVHSLSDKRLYRIYCAALQLQFKL